MLSKFLSRGRVLALAFVAAGSVLALPGISSAEVPSNQVPDSLKAAIKQAVEARGQRYAGFCRDINQNPNPSQFAGYWCNFVLTLTSDRAEVTMGAVLSDELQAVTFVRSGNTWVPAGSSTETISAELQAAIKAAVEARGQRYAGFCLDVNQSPNPAQYAGQWCAFVKLSGDRAEVTLGPVLSNELHAVTFIRAGNTWTPADDTTRPSIIPAELQAAIKREIEARGGRYAGFCPEINSSQNPSQYVGQWCAFVRSFTSDRAEVTIGQVLSDSNVTLTFVRAGANWSTGTGGTAGGVRPPSTGDAGLAREEGKAYLPIAAAALGVSVLGAFSLVRRRV